MPHIKQRKHQPLSTSASLGAALLGGLLVHAEVQAEESTTALPKISIQAEQPTSNVGMYEKEYRSGIKFTEPVSRTPKTIHIISKDVLGDQHATTLAQAMRNTPGVGTFSLGENGSTDTGDALMMRGFYVNGSIFNDGVRDSGNYSRDTFNTEQVEVIKGPDGSAFGRTAPSGSINMATKKATTGEHSIINLSGGTHDQKRATLDTNYQINDTTALRLNLMGENSGEPKRDLVRNKRWGIAPAVTFGLGTEQRLELDYLHLQQRNTPDGGLPTVGLPGWSAPSDASFNNAPKVNRNNFYGSHSDFDNVTVDIGTLHYEYDLNYNLTFHNTARYGRTHQDYLLTSFMVNNDSNWDHNDLSQWEMTRSGHTKDQTNIIATNQMGFVHDVSTGPLSHTLSYGVEVTYEKVELDGTETIGMPNSVIIYHPSHDEYYSSQKTGADAYGRTDTLAAYLFDTITIGEHWQLNMGLRADRYKSRFNSLAQCDDTNGRAPDCHGANTGDLVTDLDNTSRKTLLAWQLGALYQINEYGNLYVNYAVAHEPPGANGLVVSRKEKDADHPNYDPQKASTAEIGTKWKLADDQLLLAAALFSTDVDNQVEKDPVDGLFYQSGKKRVDGIELSATGQITPNWNISTGYTHLNSKVRSGSSEVLDGSDDLTYTPQNAFTSWTTYRTPIGIVVGGGARYMGQLKRTGKATGAPDHAPSYWVADLMASYPITPQTKMQLNIYNLADKNYIASINRSGYRYSPGAPRTAMLSLNHQF